MNGDDVRIPRKFLEAKCDGPFRNKQTGEADLVITLPKDSDVFEWAGLRLRLTTMPLKKEFIDWFKRRQGKEPKLDNKRGSGSHKFALECFAAGYALRLEEEKKK